MQPMKAKDLYDYVKNNLAVYIVIYTMKSSVKMSKNLKCVSYYWDERSIMIGYLQLFFALY